MDRITVIDDEDFQADLKYKAICDAIGSKLAMVYPGYRWRVEGGGGIADVRCEHASGTYGYTFNLVKNGIPDSSDVIRAGGEILESFNLSRRSFDTVEFLSRPRILGDLVMVR